MFVKRESFKELASESPNQKKETTIFSGFSNIFVRFGHVFFSPIRPFIDDSTLAKEAMNPEEMSKLFQDIKEAKAAGKEIVYVSLANMTNVIFGNL